MFVLIMLIVVHVNLSCNSASGLSIVCTCNNVTVCCDSAVNSCGTMSLLPNILAYNSKNFGHIFGLKVGR